MDELNIKNNSNTPTSVLVITLKDKGKVFEVCSDGSIGYTIKGKYRIAKTDKQLGVALAEALKAFYKLNEDEIKKQSNVHFK